MMLDQSGRSCKGENKVCHEKPDEFDRAYACQNRFHYVNHLLVMRAIYEGMITPIVVFFCFLFFLRISYMAFFLAAMPKFAVFFLC